MWNLQDVLIYQECLSRRYSHLYPCIATLRASNTKCTLLARKSYHQSSQRQSLHSNRRENESWISPSPKRKSKNKVVNSFRRLISNQTPLLRYPNTTTNSSQIFVFYFCMFWQFFKWAFKIMISEIAVPTQEYITTCSTRWCCLLWPSCFVCLKIIKVMQSPLFLSLVV